MVFVVDVSVDGRAIRAGTYGWYLGEAGDRARVEVTGHTVCVDPRSVEPCPVGRPRIEDLRKREPCFGTDMLAFEELYLDAERGQRVLRCRAHGRLFVESRRGYKTPRFRLVLADRLAGESLESLARRHASISDDLLNHRGTAL